MASPVAPAAPPEVAPSLSPEDLSTLRHSASHVMAQAVVELFPGTKLAIGPSTDEGFYYDFDSPHTFTTEDFEPIEKRMKEIIKGNFAFELKPVAREEALEHFRKEAEVYKVDLIEGFPPDEPVSYYQHSTFSDLCRGPHLPSTGKIGAYKLLSVAGAYWRGNESNKMLQRIYATAYATKP